MSKLMPPPLTADRLPIALPTSPETEWRLSFCFRSQPTVITTLSIGAGVLTLLLLAAQIW